MRTNLLKNNRGIALLIVLLVTALLIALIFEFAYATRISLNSAINFRDSQRAYFIARAGVFLFAKYPQLQDNLPQGVWSPPLPYVSEGDTQVRVRWEDENGKISIQQVFKGNDSYKRLQQLFDIKSVNQDVLDNGMVGKRTFFLLSELHQVMGDEDYRKVNGFLTVVPVSQININTASPEVLQTLCRSMGKDDGIVSLIVNKRNEQPFASSSEITNMPGMDPLLASYLTYQSTTYTVYSYATVGGYTRQVQAIIQRSGGSMTPLYWREL